MVKVSPVSPVVIHRGHMCLKGSGEQYSPSPYTRTTLPSFLLLASCDLVAASVGTLDEGGLTLVPYAQNKTRLGQSLARRHLKFPPTGIPTHRRPVKTLSRLSTSNPCNIARKGKPSTVLAAHVSFEFTDCRSGLYQGSGLAHTDVPSLSLRRYCSDQG